MYIDFERYEEPSEPPVRKSTWRDWDGWLLVAYLSLAVIAAIVTVGYGHVQ